MKHLIEAENPSGLPIAEYDRIILDSATDEIVYRGGVDNANILMLSETGYQLYGQEGDDGQINNYWVFEYTGTEEYEGKEYFKYSLSDTHYILAPTRNITKMTFPFDNYYTCFEGEIFPLLNDGWDSLYGFTSVPENKVLMKRRTDIGTNANGKDYVDLGLTSGTLWATMNVGATRETHFGSYFQWGETKPHDNGIPYDWANYKYCNGSEKSLTKYCTNSSNGTVDNKLTLDLEDDAARVHMGGDWRMPSAALMEELKSETTSEWVEDFNGTGKNGRKFTSKADPSKYIFIPASGYRSGSLFRYSNTAGEIWSSSLGTSRPAYAKLLNLGSTFINTGGSTDRCYGLTVRGVL